MIELTLMTEEVEVLRDTLDYCLSDLRTEIAHTDNSNYRSMLKRQEVILRRLHHQLQVIGIASVPALV